MGSSRDDVYTLELDSPLACVFALIWLLAGSSDKTSPVGLRSVLYACELCVPVDAQTKKKRLYQS